MKVHSFDVFDTVVTRIVARPSDVFYLVADAISRVPEIPAVAAQRFAPAREWSEFRARRNSTRGDVSLDEIYAVLGYILSLDAELTRSALECELAVERLVSVPVAATIARIQRLRQMGERIVFVSDMYLPSDFLRELLVAVGAASTDDPLYVSGELGMTKGSGKLFDLLLEREAVNPSQVTHYGDNYHSDYDVPRRRGITVPAWNGSVHSTTVSRGKCILSYGTRVIGARLKLEMLRAA